MPCNLCSTKSTRSVTHSFCPKTPPVYDSTNLGPIVKETCDIKVVTATGKNPLSSRNLQTALGTHCMYISDTGVSTRHTKRTIGRGRKCVGEPTAGPAKRMVTLCLTNDSSTLNCNLFRTCWLGYVGPETMRLMDNTY